MQPGGSVPRPSRPGRPTGLSAASGRYCSPGMADGRREPKSKYTADRGFAGAFEGETVTRRRMMTLTAHGAGAVARAAFVLPALGFAVGSALLEPPPVRWEPVGKPDDF